MVVKVVPPGLTLVFVPRISGWPAQMSSAEEPAGIPIPTMLSVSVPVFPRVPT